MQASALLRWSRCRWSPGGLSLVGRCAPGRFISTGGAVGGSEGKTPSSPGGDNAECSNDFENTSSTDDSIKVTVIGAAGRVGRTLSLLLKTSPLIDHLCMFDIDRAVKGFCVDIGHIDTKCSVDYVCGMRNIEEALDDPDVVVIAAGTPTSPQVNGKKLFKKNAPIVAGLSEACARFCPDACIVLITNPINSLLPVAAEVCELVTGTKPSERLFGLTTLDVVRANTFIAEAIRHDPSKVIVPVIGGTSEDTIVPVISQMKPCCKIKHEEIVALTECVKQAEGSLTDCQNCGTRGASSLSTAYAAFRFSSSLVSALRGGKNVVECAYVQSKILPELEYMASPLKLGLSGIEYNYGYPKLSDYEVSLMERAAVALERDVKIGKAYVIEERGKHYERKRRLTMEKAAEAQAQRQCATSGAKCHRSTLCGAVTADDATATSDKRCGRRCYRKTNAKLTETADGAFDARGAITLMKKRSSESSKRRNQKRKPLTSASVTDEALDQSKCNVRLKRSNPIQL